MKPQRWFDAVSACQQRGERYALVTVLSVAGSAPRDAGTKMVITGAETFDTIGGGHLEYAVTNTAREYLAGNNTLTTITDYPLSGKLGQCCGGAVQILYEVFCDHVQHIAVFGAGHVAQSLVPILAQLPLQIHWIDSRSELLEGTEMPPNVRCVVDDEPEYVCSTLPENTWLLILTHNHQLDFAIVEKALQARHFPFVGMIGSDTKARRFNTRLARKGYSEEQRACLISPVGDTRIPGKRPVEVAISISAQIVQRLHAPEKAPTASISKELQNV